MAEEGCPVDPVTGRVLETDAIRARGLAALRSKMDAAVRGGATTKWWRDDDQFLLPFLRARKYKIDSAFKVGRGSSVCGGRASALWRCGVMSRPLSIVAIFVA